MLNIPTDVLRSLLAVADVRSFTKAAQLMGVTQPAVSAQIKRLQFLLGFDLLDKSAPGVSLTGQFGRLPALAAELARRPVAVIAVTPGAAPAANAETTTIPTAFVVGGDPVQAGLASLVEAHN